MYPPILQIWATSGGPNACNLIFGNNPFSSLNKFIDYLIYSLDHIGFLQPDHKRKDMIQNIRTIFHKIKLSDKEMRILMGIFSSLKQKKVDWQT